VFSLTGTLKALEQEQQTMANKVQLNYDKVNGVFNARVIPDKGWIATGVVLSPPDQLMAGPNPIGGSSDSMFIYNYPGATKGDYVATASFQQTAPDIQTDKIAIP
jgi:hypothetical protein